MLHNRLNGMRCYLAGPMDRVPDGGIIWRNELTPFLQVLGVHVLDPCNKPIDTGTEDAEHRKQINQWKETGEFDKVAEWVKIIRAIDLRMVDLSDFIVVHIDMDVQMCGTYEEIFWANRLKRPILIHCAQGKENIPSWLFGVLPHELMFSDWDELKNYLIHVHRDECVQSFNRWIFFNYNKIDNRSNAYALCI